MKKTMKNMRKYVVFCLCFVLFLFLLLFSGCGTNNNVASDPGTSTPESVVSTSPETEQTESPVPSQSADVAPTDAKGNEVEKTKAISIYTINDESLEPQAAVVQIPSDSEITAELIVKTVVNNLKEHSLEVGIDSITVDKDRVIVSFLYGTAPINNVGAGVETTILDCISGSLLDNIESCKQVVFRAEGKSYESGHQAYGIDEAYAWK